MRPNQWRLMMRRAITPGRLNQCRFRQTQAHIAVLDDSIVLDVLLDGHVDTRLMPQAK